MAEKNDFVCTVVSIVPFAIHEEKPGLIPGRYFIPASVEEDPQILKVATAAHFVYLDEARGHLQVRDSPLEVARSIVEDFSQAQLGVSEDAKPGIFFTLGDFSKAEVIVRFKSELAQSSRFQRAWFLNLCRIADDDWNKHHQHNVISSFQRLAAKALNWDPKEHLWMNPEVRVKTGNCPACANPVVEGMIVCPNCKCILDKEKHKALTFA